jgi:hypothetical protein
MLVLIMMLVLAFIIPFLGIGFAIYLLLKFRLDIYPRWVRTVAIVAFVYQIVLLSGVFLQYLFFLQILRKVFKILKRGLESLYVWRVAIAALFLLN